MFVWLNSKQTVQLWKVLRGHDDIIYVTDVVYDYYDQKGLFDEQAGEEVELDEEDIIAFACKRDFHPHPGSGQWEV